MNKAELINAIAETSGMTKVASKKALDATIKSITKALANGEKVGLVGFGTFTVADRAFISGGRSSRQRLVGTGCGCGLRHSFVGRSDQPCTADL